MARRTAPTLGAYPSVSVTAGQNTLVTPGAAPTNTVRASTSTHTNFTGVLSVNPATGAVTVTDAKQAGVYAVTVQAFNGSCAGTTATFPLTVTDPACSAGGFSGSTNVAVGSAPYSVAVGDFNGDGKQDFAAANDNSNTVSIRLGDGAGGFSGSTDVGVGANPASVAVGDFNGDGKQDFAAANDNSNTVSIRLGDGAGGFSGSTNVGVGIAPYSVAVGDFNGDGKQDFAAANFISNSVSIRLGDGAGDFSGSTDVGVGFAPYSVAVGDFNGDGKQDFAAANFGSTTVSIRLGDGAGGFSGSTNVGVGNSPASVAVGDFNGDGDQDFAAANLISNSVSIRLGDGAGGFSGSTNVAVGSAPFSVAVGDFNSDGRQDFATANFNSATVSIRLGDGAGGFSGSTEVGVGVNPASVAMGDFNGDGKQDFAVANQGSNTVSIRLGDGAGGFSGSADVGVGTSPRSVAVGDFNGDGKQDFAAANYGSSTVSIRLGAANDINVRGNGTDIADGDNTPSATDHTDFGQTTGTPITRTFTIQNTGNLDLNLGAGAITLSGGNAALFSVGNVSLPATVASPNGTLTFDVTYTPGVNVGVHTATVHIASDECDEADYDFAVRGELTCTAASFTACPPAPVAASADAGVCYKTAVTYDATASGTPTPALTYAFTGATTGSGSGTGSGASFNVGTTTVTVTATNACSAPTCTFSVQVTDNQNPSIVCPTNITRSNDANQCGAVVAYANPTFSDNCPDPVLLHTSSANTASGSTFPVGTTMVNWKVTDAAGNEAVCQFTVTVVDNQSPGLTCPANIVRSADAGQCYAVVTYATPTATDNCGSPTVTRTSAANTASGSQFPKGTTVVEWKATDTASPTANTATCSFTVTVNDAQLPNITCPASQTVGNTPGSCSATVNYATPAYSDNCSGGGAAIQSGIPSGGVFPKGQTTVVWRATDAAGLTRTCSFRVTVNDTEAPVITCPSGQSANTAPSNCTANVTYPTPTAVDNCPGAVTVVRVSGPASGGSFPLGSTNVTWRAIDGAGRSSTCSFSVTVADATPPVVTCPGNIAVTGSGSPCTAVATYATPTATDNCGVQSVFLLSGLPSGSSFPAGATVNTWRAVDNAGLSHSCSFTVTVGCGVAPSIVGGSNKATAQNAKAMQKQEVLSKQILGLSLSPNPASEQVLITASGLGDKGGELLLWDALGRLVWRREIAAGNDVQSVLLLLSDANLSEGVYQVSLRTDTALVTKALVANKL